MNHDFLNDVNEGLSSFPKTLSSKYFYNKKGDELFVKIMHMPEYYLTRAELDIFQNSSAEMVKQLAISPNNHFEIIELGAGDGLKTKELLKYLKNNNYDFTYKPIDISQNALDQIERNINDFVQGVSIEKIQGDYFQILGKLRENPVPKVILFLGSNTGNMRDEIAQSFIGKICDNLNKHDKLVLGLDLIKSKEIVLPAYNDEQGYTRDFNLNLLQRINNELGGNFDLNEFEHAPEYTEDDGIAKSFLRSKKEQTIEISALNKSFHFEKDEIIATEISRKYNEEILSKILSKSNFAIKGRLYDSKKYFCDFILNKV